ncbi:MAG: hypothetical protein ACFFB5_22920 [Promethearchaeota archaeon]
MITRKLRTVVLFLVFFLGSMFSLPSGASPATIIWEEDFESDLDNWKIFGVDAETRQPRPGNFSIIDGTLRIKGNTTLYSIAEHPSTQATGTWSFDVNVTPSPDHFYIAFFGGEFGNFTGEDGFEKACPSEYGVMPVPEWFSVWFKEFVFYKRKNGSSNIVELGSFHPPQILGWHHFDITRNIEGKFNVFIDGSNCTSFQDTTYNTTGVFKFYGGPGPGLDNIVVYDHFTFKGTNASGWTFVVGLFALSIYLFRKKLLSKK